MIAAILNSAILDSAQKKPSLIFWLNFMMDSSYSAKFHHLSFPFPTHSDLQRSIQHLTQTHSFIHSDSTWWWQPSWILPCLHSDILVIFSQTHSHLPRLWVPLLTLKKTFTHSFWLTWWVATILNSAILDSAILHKTLSQIRFNLTQTHSFSLNLMMAAILNSANFIQPLPSWIQTPCYLLSELL